MPGLEKSEKGLAQQHASDGFGDPCVHMSASGALASYPTDVSIRSGKPARRGSARIAFARASPSMSGICRSKLARSNGWDESRVVPSNSKASCAEAATVGSAPQVRRCSSRISRLAVCRRRPGFACSAALAR